MLYPKRKQAGKDERRAALESSGFMAGLPDVAVGKSRGLGMDDVLDAYAACWTAKRIVRGKAIRIPAKPSQDSMELRMEIWR